ncbi:tetratricopeptide repeat protein [Leptospira sp. 201903074]|uniref:tetratricopeptide repeat protein n=1 Tax=Leptospira abararensis TaxID=2810036 RepID=UPI001965810C|nr:tetratricopeptide repeat protein [Leptospira abararensis]MBM9547853.1 tetratricopeptide repeat protein [Leptospira abararensis]
MSTKIYRTLFILLFLVLNCKNREDAISLYAKGVDFYSKKSLEKALVEFSGAVKADNSFVSARLMKGKTEYYLGKHENAAETFQDILDDFPGNATSLTWLGKIYMLDSSKRDDAKQKLSLAIQLDDNQIDAHYYLGKLFEQEGNVKDALIQYSHGIEIAKRSDKIKRDLNEIYRNAGLSGTSDAKESTAEVSKKPKRK